MNILCGASLCLYAAEVECAHIAIVFAFSTIDLTALLRLYNQL